MKAEKRQQSVQFISTLFGCAVVLVPSGVAWYWGNMSIYVYSYIHYHRNTNSRVVTTPWLLSVYIIMWSTGMLVTGHVIKFCSRRVLAALAMGTFNCGILSSYFVLGKSLRLLDVTVGMCSGFGNGVLFSIVLQTVVEWVGKRVGLAASTVVSGSSIGAVLINQLVTHYVNPDNLKVDKDIGRTKYFSQKEILERVPNIFLILTALSMSCHIIGFFFICQRPKNAKTKDQGSENNASASSIEPIKNRRDSSLRPLLQNLKDIDSKLTSVATEGETQKPARISYLDSSIQIHDQGIVPVTSWANRSSKSPKEVLCSTSFYILWIMLASVDSGFVLICNYYKAFGQVWVKDDHFLTNLATALSVTNIGMRIVWGLTLDHFDFKTTLICFASSLSIINCFYFFTPAVNKWLYFFWTLAYGSFSCGVYVNFATIVSSLYGMEHFHTNYGLLFTSTIAVNLIAPPCFRLLLQQWGWFALFTSTGCMCLLSLVLVIVFLSPMKGGIR